MSINETECFYCDVIIITLQNDVSEQNKTMPSKGSIARLQYQLRFYDAVSLEDSDNPGNRGQQQTRRDIYRNCQKEISADKRALKAVQRRTII